MVYNTQVLLGGWSDSVSTQVIGNNVQFLLSSTFKNPTSILVGPNYPKICHTALHTLRLANKLTE